MEYNTGKDVGRHSFYQKEDEILLILGKEFEVFSMADKGNQLTMIQLREVEPHFPNIASVPAATTRTWSSIKKTTKEKSTADATAAVISKGAPKSQLIVESLEISCQSNGNF